MKKLVIFLFIFLLSFAASAGDLSKDSLQGSWLILTLQGESDEDNDRWEFEGNKFYQNLGGRRISPDEFKVVGDVIDLGYAKISVSKFDGKKMTATMAGFEYTLEKQ